MATSPAFAQISHDDYRGLLWIAAILSLIFVLLTLSARLYVRKHMLGRDDYASIVAVIFGIAQYAIVFIGMSLGLGTSRASVRKGNEAKAARIFLASQALLICVLYATKLSVLLTTERLVAGGIITARNSACIAVRMVVGLAAFGSLLIINIGSCMDGLLMPKSDKNYDCQVSQWITVSVLDSVTELCILGLFYSIIWSLQMRRRVKIALAILLGFRIICTVLTAIYTLQVALFVSSSLPPVRIVIPLVWQQGLLGYSIISALIVALVPFIKSFHTGMGVDVRSLTKLSSGESATVSHPFTYGLQQLSRCGKPNDAMTRVSAESEEVSPHAISSNTQPRQLGTKSKIRAGRASTHMSDEMGIQKTVNWSVRYEDDGHP